MVAAQAQARRVVLPGALKVDIEATPALAAEHGVRSVPTMVLAHGERVLARHGGAMADAAFHRWLAAGLGHRSSLRG